MKTYRYYICDNEFGRVRVHYSRQARRFIFRADSEGLTLTCNPISREKDIRDAVERLRPKLREMLERNREKELQLLLKPGYRLSSDIFELRWEKGDATLLSVRYRQGVMTVHYHEFTDFTDAGVQRWLIAQLNHNLRLQATAVLPKRLGELAKENGLSYNGVGIRKTRTRWGSCSSRGNISLSSQLVLLPHHLRDYVMLHELCHTREMNHSAKFWALLDGLVGGKNGEYRSEIREYDKSDIIHLLHRGD